MKRSNVIGILAAAAVIVLSVVLISWYLTKRTPTLIQGTVECTTYKASSKVPGRIDDMKVAQGDRVEKGQLLYTLSTPELEAKLRQAEAVKSAAAALDAMALAGARVQQIEAAMNMWQKAQAGLELARKTYERVQNLYNDGVVPAQKLDEATANIDTETELLIQDSLEKMRSVGTMLMVAHRLSTIQHADNIIVLSHGKILEQGTHQELLAKHGRYYQLYTLQYHKEQMEE